MLQSYAEIAQVAQVPHKDHVIVVGGGPVGIRAAQRIAAHGLPVTVLSAEAVSPYNRVRLSPLLSGDVQFGDITLPDISALGDNVACVEGCRAVALDPAAKTVTTADGFAWGYSQLVLATGSRAFVPNIPGKDLAGVYTFRTAEDASALIARSFSARKVAVIGGGLLGLEAARGMRRRQCNVHVIEHENRLMPRQLDVDGAGLLAEYIQSLDVNIVTDMAVREITGTDRVDGIVLANNKRIDCDTVIICTGVRANIELARDAGLAFGRGVIVNDQMQTSDPDILAVGECTEHDGIVYGLVGPGFAQADVAAETIAGKPAAFHASIPATKLKVIGAEVFSVGDIEQLEIQANVRSHVWRDAFGYRRIFVARGRLVGAIAVGEWPQASLVQDAAEAGVTVYPWMVFRFRRTGFLWPDAELTSDALPDTSTLCNCTGATCGQVRGAIANGCITPETIGLATGAGTVCGTCRPRLQEMLDAGSRPEPEPVPLWKPVLALSTLAVLGAVYPLIAGHVPLPESYSADSLRTWLWRDNIVKQWSGFILLGITLAALCIGLRKRIRLMDRLGSFDGWRLAHIVIGIAAMVAFLAHTGFRLGQNLNFWLGAGFVSVVVLGAIAGLATGGDHELRARQIGSASNPPRSKPTWLHIIAVWPLPVLILIHVLASYAF